MVNRSTSKRRKDGDSVDLDALASRVKLLNNEAL